MKRAIRPHIMQLQRLNVLNEVKPGAKPVETEMKVLVINSGSSSIKYRLFDMPRGAVLASGAVERIDEAEGLHRYRVAGRDGAMVEFVD
ncbi:MAG: hypothetical protein U9P11_06300, partial [Pseudomonadota bacterium]|nr:hypothetical protein [Pseudomonadota bacterium]